jgi:signal transduction histidine kinase
MALAVEPFSLDEVIDDVVSSLTPAASIKEIGIMVLTDGKVPRPLFGDRGRIRQILFNIVGNAVKFTEKGAVTIEYGCYLTDSKREYVRMTVKDTGIGIAHDALPHLFQRFAQLDGSTTRKYGGTGLGLYIVKQLLTMMDGSVDVTSSPGIGSTFTVCFPLRKS